MVETKQGISKELINSLYKGDDLHYNFTKKGLTWLDAQIKAIYSDTPEREKQHHQTENLSLVIKSLENIERTYPPYSMRAVNTNLNSAKKCIVALGELGLDSAEVTSFTSIITNIGEEAKELHRQFARREELRENNEKIRSEQGACESRYIEDSNKIECQKGGASERFAQYEREAQVLEEQYMSSVRELYTLRADMGSLGNEIKPIGKLKQKIWTFQDEVTAKTAETSNIPSMAERDFLEIIKPWEYITSGNIQKKIKSQHNLPDWHLQEQGDPIENITQNVLHEGIERVKKGQISHWSDFSDYVFSEIEKHYEKYIAKLPNGPKITLLGTEIRESFLTPFPEKPAGLNEAIERVLTAMPSEDAGIIRAYTDSTSDEKITFQQLGDLFGLTRESISNRLGSRENGTVPGSSLVSLAKKALELGEEGLIDAIEEYALGRLAVERAKAQVMTYAKVR